MKQGDEKCVLTSLGEFSLDLVLHYYHYLTIWLPFTHMKVKKSGSIGGFCSSSYIFNDYIYSFVFNVIELCEHSMDEVPALRIRHVAFERVQISAVLD